jgi:hypothetical protein
MYKKFTLAALLLVVGAGTAFGQSVKDEWVKIPYLQLPRQPFSEEVTTYATRILIPDGLAADQDRNAITANLANAAAIPGYEEAQNANGVIVEISLGWYAIPNSPELITTTKREKRGDKEVEVEYYNYRIQFRYPMRLRVLQGDQVIEDTYVRNSNDFDYASTQLFPSKEALYKFWQDGGNKFKSDVRNSHLEANRSAIKTHMVHQYGYVKSHMREEINFVKEKKDSNDYPKMTAALEIVKNATAKKTADDVYPSADYVSSINEAMALWKEELAQAEPENRKARVNKKVTEGLLKNMVIACYFSYQFSEADEYLARLEQMKEGYFVRNMREKMADVQYRLAQYEKIYARN